MNDPNQFFHKKIAAQLLAILNSNVAPADYTDKLTILRIAERETLALAKGTAAETADHHVLGVRSDTEESMVLYPAHDGLYSTEAPGAVNG